MNPWLAFFHPSLIARKWLRKEGGWSLKTKLKLDWFPYPHYAYCINQAAVQAKRLGLNAISAIEFGIGDGSGLVAIHIYGFDTGEGLPPSTDPRDLPYVRKPGVDKMDRAAPDAELKRSTLIIGDLKETVPAFFENHSPAPIGFVSFGLAYYTLTVDALCIFEAASEIRLPRTLTCFGNIIGTDDEFHCEHVGELLAIEEFNRDHDKLKLGRINGLKHKRIFHSAWTEQVFVLHDLAHPRYGDYTGPSPDRQAPLK